MKPGSAVSQFEQAFAQYVGARWAIACSNGTVTLEVALRALGVKPGDRVATTPLTMAATSIAILNVGAVPVYCDVDPETWLIADKVYSDSDGKTSAWLPVSLYGLNQPWRGTRTIDDAAQTLRPNSGCAFTSYSFQASKILALGEGGMLVTDSEELATLARSISSLGYDMRPEQSRIEKNAIKSPSAIRHVRYPAINARMNDLTAREGLFKLQGRVADRAGDQDVITLVERAKRYRLKSAAVYRDAISGCDWITPQKTPEGYSHDYWAFAVALKSPELWHPFAESIVRHGGEMPYGAWQITYKEPAFQVLAPPRFDATGRGNTGHCPIAEDLQPRLMQFQTNNLQSAERNAAAVRLAIREVGG